MIVADALANYQLGLIWSQAATTLSRLLDNGHALESGDRAELVAAADACARVRLDLLSLPERPVGRAVLRVVQPLFSRPALVEALGEAEHGLKTVGGSPAGGERLALGLGKLSWLVEFLSDCCILLLRDIATQSVPHALGKGA